MGQRDTDASYVREGFFQAFGAGIFAGVAAAFATLVWGLVRMSFWSIPAAGLAFLVFWSLVELVSRSPHAARAVGWLRQRGITPAAPAMALRPQESAATAKRQLSPYEIEQMLMRCDALLTFLRQPAEDVQSQGWRIIQNAWYAARAAPETHAKCIYDYRDKAGAAIAELEQFRSANTHLPDINSLLLSNDEYSNFLNAITHFGRTFERMAPLAKEALNESDFTYLMEPRHDELDKRLREFARWRSQTMTKLIALRARLSST